MKTIIQIVVVTVISLLLNAPQVLSQHNTISIDRTFYSDTTIRPFDSIQNIFGLKINGSVNLYSDSSLVRIILIDASNEKYLTYEIYPLLDTNESISLTEACEETCLLNNIDPYQLQIQLIDASVYIDELVYLDQGIQNLVYVRDSLVRIMISDKIDNINQTIQDKELPWYAGETPLAIKTFQEKIDYFGQQDLPNLQGIEYYIGGFFVILPYEGVEASARSFTITDEFDWRNRHSANDPNSLYYDGDETGSGWIPNRREGQICPDCWAFAPVYTTEAIENLYYNQHIDENLSEQYVISCTGDTVCHTGGLPEVAIAFIRNNGVMNEECFPYQPQDDIYCNKQCATPEEMLSISGYSYTYGASQNGEYYIKKNLIVNGPQSVRMNIWGHAISLVGFGKIKVGDLILDGNHAPDGIEKLIEEGDPWIGKSYWIFKNSWGSWGHNGTEFYYVIADAKWLTSAASLLTPLTSLIYDDDDIQCLDLDSDGYYNWGLTAIKPDTCPECSDSCDCDDSKSYLGPYDENYNCTLICDQFVLNPDTLFISSDDTWYGIKYINQIVVIEDQAKLTIKGVVGFCEDAAIIVDRGSELLIDGGILHGTCSNMWQGIEVWGTTTASQSTSGTQGKITIENGGIIENAIMAVVLARTDGLKYAPGYEGGIIQTNDAHFINNRIGVRFLPYQNIVSGVELDNLSYFHYSEFLTNDELADESIPENFIYLDDVMGIDVQGCTFTNSRPEEDAAMRYRGVGIYGEDADFTVNDSSSFSNLNYGIKAFDLTSTKTFEVTHSAFINNMTGIYSKGIDNSVIIFNDFDVYYISIFHGPDDIFGGLYLDNCTGYTVEENNFYNEDEYPSPDEILSIGITVNNSEDNLNMIYRNTFNLLHMGILAQNRNRGTSNSTGLKLKCNICTDNRGDFAVTADTASANKGISIHQGAYIPNDKTAPAGNLFSHANNNNPYSDFNNTIRASWIYYFHHYGTSQNPWVPVYYQNITPIPFVYYDDFDTVCPSNFSFGGGHLKSEPIVMDEEELIARMSLMENLRDSTANVLSLWIDAGNTPELNYEVEFSTPEESLEIYDELMADSPYLSDTVLSTSIAKEDVLVNAMIRDIMVANPHGVKKEELIEALEQRVPPVPEYMMAEIMAGLDSIALKEQRESEIAWYEQERALAFNKLMKIYLGEDNSTSAEESIISLITDHGNLNDNYYLANRYLEQGNISNAFTVLANLPNQFVMDSEQEIEHQDYLTLFTMVSNIMQQGKPLDSLDNTSRQVLYQMAENDSRPAIMAQNILQHIDSASYPEVYILPASGPVLRRYTAENPDYITGLDQEKIFSVYPNPCRDYFIMEYYFEIAPKQASYSISDPLGRIIEEGLIEGQQNQLIRRTSSYSSGLYTIKLIINGEVEKALKLNVIK